MTWCTTIVRLICWIRTADFLEYSETYAKKVQQIWSKEKIVEKYKSPRNSKKKKRKKELKIHNYIQFKKVDKFPHYI